MYKFVKQEVYIYNMYKFTKQEVNELNDYREER